MRSKMPENLLADRKAVVKMAYSLLGKVNYFWGGKSSAIGWDKRWGTSVKVTSARQQDYRNRAPLWTGLLRLCGLGVQ